ncbi:MAG: hypothetical protein AAFN92_04130 [Bacteroidota bacterium]
MSKIITRRQARMMERFVSTRFGRNFIPVRTTTSLISLGDVLEKRKDDIAKVNGDLFEASKLRTTNKLGEDETITSEVGVTVTNKLKGKAISVGDFSIGEAGLHVSFSKSQKMFLQLWQPQQIGLSDFPAFRTELLDRYLSGDISPKVFVVDGVLLARQFYLKFSSSGGTDLMLDLKTKVAGSPVEGGFSFRSSTDRGRTLNGLKGGILGYQLSSVRLRREQLPKALYQRMLEGVPDNVILSELTPNKKLALMDADALTVQSVTHEVLSNL